MRIAATALAAVIVAVLLWYALAGRDWLKKKTWAQGFFTWIEPYEIILFKKSATILKARLQMAVGFLLMLCAQFSEISLTPLLPFLPDEYAGYATFAINMLPLILSFLGWADERLRYSNTKPVELVALAEKDITPAVAQAVAVAEIAKVEAVAAVKAETEKAA